MPFQEEYGEISMAEIGESTQKHFSSHLTALSAAIVLLFCRICVPLCPLFSEMASGSRMGCIPYACKEPVCRAYSPCFPASCCHGMQPMVNEGLKSNHEERTCTGRWCYARTFLRRCDGCSDGKRHISRWCHRCVGWCGFRL